MPGPTLIQTSTKTSGTTVLSIDNSFSSAPTEGNFVAVVVHTYGPVGSLAGSELTDNQGNSYSVAVQKQSSSPGCAVYYCPSIGPVSGTFTMTFTWDAFFNGWLAAQEWSGMGLAPSCVTATNEGGTGTSITSGTTASVVPPSGGALVIACVSTVSPSGAPTVETVSPAWSTIASDGGSFFNPDGMSNDRVITASGTQSCSWTSASSGETWAAAIVVFAPEPTTTRGSAVFGVTTTVQATRAIAFGLDNRVNVHDTPGMFKVFGDAWITGDLTVEGDLISSSTLLETIIHSIVTAGGDVVVDSDGNVVFET
jgi:hypothetical protein